jgi:sulfoxide reductase catalytic subunit YedY
MRFLGRSWEMSEAATTPEALFFERRRLIGLGAGALAAGLVGRAHPARAAAIDGMLPATANAAFHAAEPLTPEDAVVGYNNFYEFGFSKYVASASQKLKTSPWTITIDGLVEKPLTLDVDDLLKKVTLEERIYRHRCVEAWSMVVPWTGFPLADLVKLAAPKSDAKYLLMETFMDPKVAPYQSAPQDRKSVV